MARSIADIKAAMTKKQIADELVAHDPRFAGDDPDELEKMSHDALAKKLHELESGAVATPAAVIPTPAVDFQPEDILGAKFSDGKKELKKHGMKPRVVTDVEAPGMARGRIIRVARIPGRPNLVDISVANRGWWNKG